MNAAARVVHQSVLSRHLVITHFLSKQQMVLMTFALAAVLSALSVIYMTHVTRVLHANLQHSKIEHGRLQVERGQLLLEHSTWMRQARIETIAQDKLGMVAPTHESVVIIHE